MKHTHWLELTEMRNTLERIGDEMLDTDFNQYNFDQLAIAYHAIASIVGYPESE